MTKRKKSITNTQKLETVQLNGQVKVDKEEIKLKVSDLTALLITVVANIRFHLFLGRRRLFKHDW